MLSLIDAVRVDANNVILKMVSYAKQEVCIYYK